MLPFFQSGTDAYNKIYRTRLCIDQVQSDCKKGEVGSDGGNIYGQNVPKNAIDDKDNTFWESTNPEAAWWITFEENIPVKTIAFCTRRDTDSKGFPKNLKVLSYDGKKWSEVMSLTDLIFIKVTVFITLPSEITCKGIKLQFNGAYENAPSLSHVSLYKYDFVHDAVYNAFTDGTWSKLNSGWDKSKLDKFKTEYSSHPLKSTGVYVDLQAARLPTVYQQILNGDDLTKNIVVLSCNNEEWYISTELRTRQHFKVYHPTGNYWLRNEIFHTYCDNVYDPNNYVPINSKAYAVQLKPTQTNNGYIMTRVGQGYSGVKFTDNLPLNESQNVYAGHYFCDGNPNYFKENPPKCRFEAGHQSLTYVIGENNESFHKKYYDYMQNVETDWMKILENKKNPNFIEARGKYNIIYTLANKVKTSIDQNARAGKTMGDMLEMIDTMQTLYQSYTGLRDGAENIRQRTFNATYVSRAETFGGGAGAAWSDAHFTGYRGDWEQMLSYPYFVGNGWVFYHEWGHAYENRRTEIIEVTTNVYSLAIQRHLKQPSRILNGGTFSIVEFDINQPAPFVNHTGGLWETLAILRKWEMVYPDMLAVMDSHFREYDDGYKNCPSIYSKWMFSLAKLYKVNSYEGFRMFGWDCPAAADNISWFESFPRPPIKWYLLDERYAIYKGNGYTHDKYPRITSIQKYGPNQKTSFMLELNLTEGSDFDDIMGYVIYDSNDNHIGYTSSNGWVPHYSIDLTKPFEFKVRIFDLKARETEPVVYRYTPSKSSIKINPELNDYTNWVWSKIPENMQQHPSEGNSAWNNLLDDDPKTCFFSSSVSSPNFERGISIDLKKKKKFSGFVVSISREGWQGRLYGYPRNFQFYISDDGKNWNLITSRNTTFSNRNSKELRYVGFDQEYEARYVKYTNTGYDLADSPLFTLCYFRLLASNDFGSLKLISSPEKSAQVKFYVAVSISGLFGVLCLVTAIAVFVRVKIIDPKRRKQEEQYNQQYASSGSNGDGFSSGNISNGYNAFSGGYSQDP